MELLRTKLVYYIDRVKEEGLFMLQRYRRMWYSPAQRSTLLLYLSAGLFVGIILLFLLTTVVFAVFSIGLPDPNKVVRREGFATIIYDRNGKVLYDLYDKENRIPQDLGSIPKYLQEATVAIEDKNFYHHEGFSLEGMARSAVYIAIGRGLQSGSTLTQQLVKNVLLSPEQSVFRKIREVILAYQIEKKFSKDQILQMYLNEAPYGGAYYGVESASRGYFGKDVKDLNLVESAILAGLPQSPSVYSPTGSHQKAYVDRTKDVLRRMREDGYISAQQEADAGKQLPDVQFASVSATIKAPHFVFFVKDQLVKQFGEQMVEAGGLRVTTTLDLELEQQAEQITHDEVLKLKAAKASNGAVVALNPKTGEILAMVGSYDYFDKDFGSYNVATALRQPGSSGKPFIYATAFEKGYTAATLITDAKTDYPSGDPLHPTYTPENYDGKYRGPTQLRFTLGNSINTAAVKMTALVGLPDIMQTGYNAGISTWQPTAENMKNVGLSLALGGREVRLLELTSAYGSFATGGTHFDPISILKVTDSGGKTLFENRSVSGKKVFSPEISFLISHILSDNHAREAVFGPTNWLQVSGHTVAVKTGTTDQKRDNWTVGYTPSVAVGVWVGNNDNSIMSPTIASGVTGATPIWNKIIKAALKNQPDESFVKPDNVVAVQVDAFSGGLPHGSDPVRSEYFLKGTEPVSLSPVWRTLKISRVNGKLANDIEVKSGNYDSKEFIVISENDPVSSDGKNRWQDAINAWIEANHKNDSLWHPPTDKSDANLNTVYVNIDSPHDHDQINNNNVEIKAKAVAARDIVKMTIQVDGSEKVNKSTNNLDETVNMGTGAHAIKVTAVDAGGNSGDGTIKIGVNVPWNYSAPTPTPSPTASGAAVPIFLVFNRF